MRVALVHDWLNHKVGGAEVVLFELAKTYPDADIFTLVYNSNKFDQHLAGRKIITSRLQHRPGFMKRNPALLLGGIQKAVDIVVVSQEKINKHKNDAQFFYGQAIKEGQIVYG